MDSLGLSIPRCAQQEHIGALKPEAEPDLLLAGNPSSSDHLWGKLRWVGQGASGVQGTFRQNGNSNNIIHINVCTFIVC